MSGPALFRLEVKVQKGGRAGRCTHQETCPPFTLTKRAACTGAGMPAVAVDGRIIEPPDPAGPSISREDTGIELTWAWSRGRDRRGGWVEPQQHVQGRDKASR